jgi:hypothetical protein
MLRASNMPHLPGWFHGSKPDSQRRTSVGEGITWIRHGIVQYREGNHGARIERVLDMLSDLPDIGYVVVETNSTYRMNIPGLRDRSGGRQRCCIYG